MVTKINKLTSKETLLGYVGTLTETQAKEAYQILLERFSCKRARVIKFNREGIQDKDGKIRLTPREYERVLEEQGEVYFHRAVEMLFDYLASLEERAECDSQLRQRLRYYNRISHYQKITKGWVAQRISEEDIKSGAGTKPANKILNVYDIETLDEAIQYINELPNSLRINNPDIEYLMLRFPQLMEDR